MDTNEQVTCRVCGDTYVPSFIKDFYPDGNGQKTGRCESCMMREELTPKNPAELPAEYLKKVCGFGKGSECCSFLAMGGETPTPKCLKGSQFEEIIHQRRERGSMVAKGDNCSGPPDFKPVTKVEEPAKV